MANVELRIWRQDNAQAAPFWEHFEVEHTKGLNVISALMKIRENPVTKDGKKTSPPIYDASCLEEVCGSCTMNINGKARQACSTLVEGLQQPIELEPMRKFPLHRDLSVDRSRMFEGLKNAKAWIPIDAADEPRACQRVERRPRVDLRSLVGRGHGILHHVGDGQPGQPCQVGQLALDVFRDSRVDAHRLACHTKRMTRSAPAVKNDPGRSFFP